jgi:para-aminobenzoate synthetase/4-amino-4-deoxychorismate lyase
MEVSSTPGIYMSLDDTYRCAVYDSGEGCWLFFEQPVDSIVANTFEGVKEALDHIEKESKLRGLWAVGWLSYEAARGFDPALVTKGEDEFPPLWFGLFRSPQRRTSLALPAVDATLPEWMATVSRDQYRDSIERIHAAIRRGDTYQVNYSFRLRAPAPRDPMSLFSSMVSVQAGSYSAYIDTGRFVVCSASPEVLFTRDGNSVECAPMKGTTQRGRFPQEDSSQYKLLLESTKDHAENVMIVDMVRNDLARVAERGSVVTAPRCDIERYPRVFQMTRRVYSSVSCSLGDLMQALYPAASITGAPKGRTMELIAELETTPRKIYTGSVGFLAPGGRQVFNVAIRTALIDRDRGEMEYGVGSGITWDSEWKSEYDECFAKAGAVTKKPPCFELFETILWESGKGYFLEERHLRRLRASCEYFGWGFDEGRVRSALQEVARLDQEGAGARRIRVFIERGGDVRVEGSDLLPLPSQYTAAFALLPVDSEDVSLFHKTTERSAYDSAVPEVPDVEDVILWNERGEITESRIANVVVDLDGELVTPPVECGLLAGCYRAELLESGVIKERVLPKEALARARAVYFVNSLRRMWQVEVVRP